MAAEFWHVWSVRNGAFSKVKYYLDNEVPEVREVFFPTILKERKAGNHLYKRRLPLYSGYIFLKYSDEENVIYYKIKSNNYISGYVGRINEKEVMVMKEKEGWNSTSKNVNVNDTVEVMVGPMKGFKGTVIAINGNKLTIKVELFGRETDASFSSEDIEIIRK
jgi:transcription antitermination factor NusG